MKKIRFFSFILLVSGLVACSPVYKFTLIQINDTYEIAPLENGKVGGMARVATLKKQIQQKQPHTFLLHAGDFLSPSVYNGINYQGDKVHGLQMIETMNAMGVDYAIMGNHEFDGTESQLQRAIQASQFTWLSSNVKNANKQPFLQQNKALPHSVVLSIPHKKSNKKLQVGLIGITLEQYQKPYLYIENIYEAAQKAYQEVAQKTDFVVALTHLSLEEDKKLAQKVPQLKLQMGGHEHENILLQEGKVRITKADANVKTAYLHHFTVKGKKVNIQSVLYPIDTNLKPEPTTQQVVDKWKNMADAVFMTMGFAPQEVVYYAQKELDGLEKSVRNYPTALTDLIGKSMLAACPECDVAAFNGGSVRIDDKLIGAITQYDVMRILPFGGGIEVVQMKGNTLQKMLQVGIQNKGTGGYLQTAGVVHKANGSIEIQGEILQPEQTYTVALSAFLLTGKEKNLDFLNPLHQEVNVIQPQKTALCSDMRKALIDYLKGLN
jgi:5'-nucleotidase